MRYLLIAAALLWATCAFGSPVKDPATAAVSVVEGTLSQVSKLPAAEGNPYPDCYYTAILDIAHIVSGHSIPKRVILVLPGFFSRQYAPEARFKVGEKVRATLVPFSSMSDKVRQTQQADEIEDVDLDFFSPQEISAIPELKTVTDPVPFAGKEQPASRPADHKPVDLEAKAARQAQMRHDLEQINKLLAEHGGDWDKWYESLRVFREEYKGQSDAKAAKWIGNCFFSAGFVDNGKIYSPDFIKSIISFKKYLDERNVDLILVRVPNKGEIVDDLFAAVPPDQVSNPYLLRFYKELLESDIEIVTDIIPRARAERQKYPLMYWYQDFFEAHPAEGMSWIIAGELAKRVNRYSTVRSTPKRAFSLKEASPSTRNFKWPGGNPKYSDQEHVRFSAVTDDKGKVVELKQGLESPVLLLGSSFIAYPSLDKGGSVPHYFAYLSGLVPDLLHRSGGDRTMYRNIVREGDEFLRGRSVCLFPFVPDTSRAALMPLPLINANDPGRILITSYRGTALHEAIQLSPDTAKEAFSFSDDGVLSIVPITKDRGAAGNIRVQLPDHISKYPYFTIELEFTSRDTTSITAKYSGQADSTLKSNDQLQNSEVFGFATTAERAVDINFEGNAKFVRAISIKAVNLYGVEQPSIYGRKTTK